jgi:hypothetical protein
MISGQILKDAVAAEPRPRRPDPLAPGDQLRPVIDGHAIHSVAPRPATFVETVEYLWNDLTARMERTEDPSVRRAFAMAKTSLEDARIRYTEARARELGVFKPADLDLALIQGQAPAEHLAERDARAAEARYAELQPRDDNRWKGPR